MASNSNGNNSISGVLSKLAGIAFLGTVLSGLGALEQYSKKTETCRTPDGSGHAVTTLDRGGRLSIYERTDDGQSQSHTFRSRDFDLGKAKEVMYQYCEEGELPRSPDISEDLEL